MYGTGTAIAYWASRYPLCQVDAMTEEGTIPATRPKNFAILEASSIGIRRCTNFQQGLRMMIFSYQSLGGFHSFWI
jgi:hypothetical protein